MKKIQLIKLILNAKRNLALTKDVCNYELTGLFVEHQEEYVVECLSEMDENKLYEILNHIIEETQFKLDKTKTHIKSLELNQKSKK